MAKTSSKISKKDPKINGVIIVDDVNGNDSTGEKYNLLKPFKTIQKGVEVYSDDDEIQVMNGDYVFTSPLFLNITSSLNIKINFNIGAKVNGEFSNSLFRSTNINQILNIYGNGEFSNIGTGSGASVFNMPCNIYGAELIYTLWAIPLLKYINVQNVKNIYSTFGPDFYIDTSSPKDGIKTGVIKNIDLIGGLGSNIALSTLSNDPNIKVYFENCNFEVGWFAINGISEHNNIVYKNCNFKIRDANRRCVFTSGSQKFYECYFENVSILETIYIDSGDCEFTNCKAKNISGGLVLRVGASIQWNGVNYFDGKISSISDIDQYVNGTIITSKAPSIFALQAFQLFFYQVTPTPGDFYYINSPDGSQIEYQVLIGDTRSEVVIGLHSAWVVKSAELNNDFTNFTPTFLDGPSLFFLRGEQNDISFTMSQGNSFTVSTNGQDQLDDFVTNPLGFTTVGGNLIIDENLSL
jgi:hypothetical protein